MNVARLVKKAKAGSKKSLLDLIMSEKDDYYRLALTYTENEQDAMDAMADMIVIVYEKLDQLKNADAFYSWSKTILVNCCRSILRKRRQLVLVDDIASQASSQSDPPFQNNAFHQKDDQIDIHSLLLYLNESQKEVIKLKYFHDLDYKTIAEITNVSVGTVKSRVFYSLRKLREIYGRDDDE